MRVPYTLLKPWNRLLSSIPSPHRFFFFACLIFVATLFYLLLYEDNSVANSAVSSERRHHPSLEEMKMFALRKSLSTDYRPSQYSKSNTAFDRILVDPESRFDISGKDVLVFIHMQKTAGTSFEKYLVHHLDISTPCECTKKRKRCICRRPDNPNENWLFSRYSTGWACGLHADYTELVVSKCVENVLDRKENGVKRRRYFHTTFLREPISRFISEFRHVSRGATWIGSRHICAGRPPTPEELPLCFDPNTGWDGVSLSEFLSCPFNLAFNRQTRMLADLTLVHCYDSSRLPKHKRDAILLESAKRNLRSLSFFGLKEEMDDSQWMFEHLFNLKFTRFLSDWHKSKSNDTVVSEDLMQRIRELNALDMELYEYAQELFKERLERMKKEGISDQQPTFSPVHNERNEDEGMKVDDGYSEEDDEYIQSSKYL